MILKDRVILLTGGAGPNMGVAIARALSKAGATLVVADLNGASATAVADELKASGASATGAQLDVTDRAACAATIDAVVKQHGRLDVLFNHAGYIGDMNGVAGTDDKMWDTCIGANLSGPFYLMRAALPHMLKQGRGAIVNTISEAGLRAAAAGAAYTASKHGLVGLTKSTAWAYAKAGIRCNGICPGGTFDVDVEDMATVTFPFPPSETPYDLDRIEPVLRLGPRILKPREIAELGVFLCSDAASALNGQIIAADAGWSVG